MTNYTALNDSLINFFVKTLKPLGTLFRGFLAVAVILLCWETANRILKVPIWLLPKPSDFLFRLATDFQLIIGHALFTSKTLLLGFGLGMIIAIPLAFIITSIPFLERGFFPLIVFLNIMPKTVIGPILVIWLGLNPLVAVLIVFLMCFFPILVDSMTGFRTIDERLFLVTRSMGANKFQTFILIRLPGAMRSILGGLRIGILKAVEGVILAEFIASQAGLGFLIMQASSFMDMPLIFATLIATGLLAVTFNFCLFGLEKILVPWL